MVIRTLLTPLLLGSLIAAPAAQTKRPDFSGHWQPDLAASKALTEKRGGTWRVAGGSSTGGAAGADRAGAGTPMITVITQSDDEIVLERRWEDQVIDRNVYKLDGSLSVNASRNTSSRSRSVWKGDSLVTTDSREIEVRRPAGQPGGPITETVTLIRSLLPDGRMQIERRSLRNGVETVTYSIMVRVGPS